MHRKMYGRMDSQHVPPLYKKSLMISIFEGAGQEHAGCHNIYHTRRQSNSYRAVK